jgi:hypothetical protein
MANRPRSERKRSGEPGKCIFCNNTGLTKEHIFSDWLKRLLPVAPNHNTCLREYSVDPSTGLGTTKLTYGRKQGAIHSRKVRVPCASCNNGWMSRVVNLARPISTQLISGNAVPLHRNQMTALATWVTLASMMAEFSHAKERIVPVEDYVYIREHQTPPPSWVILLGRYDGVSRMPMKYNIHRFMPKIKVGSAIIVDPEIKRAWSLITTYNLKHFFVQVFCTQDPGLRLFYSNHPRPAGLIRVWPPDLQAAIWPAGPGLNDEKYRFVLNDFYQAIMPAHGNFEPA